MDNIYIYVNFINRNENENENKFTVKILNNLLILNREEYFTLNGNGFYCYNGLVAEADLQLSGGPAGRVQQETNQCVRLQTCIYRNIP
jgi:hypothetical protein